MFVLLFLEKCVLLKLKWNTVKLDFCVYVDKKKNKRNRNAKICVINTHMIKLEICERAQIF